MTDKERETYQQQFEQRMAQLREQQKHRIIFCKITGKTHLQFLLYWKRKYEERFPVFNEEHWAAYFKRRLKFINMVVIFAVENFAAYQFQHLIEDTPQMRIVRN